MRAEQGESIELDVVRISLGSETEVTDSRLLFNIALNDMTSRMTSITSARWL